MQTKAVSSVGKLILLTLLCLVGAMVFMSQSHAAGPSKKVDVLIKFSKAPGSSEQALVRGHGGSIKYTYHLVPAIAASIPEQAIAALAKNPHVAQIDLDGKVHAIDAELDNTWGVKRIGAGTVHDGGNKGAGVRVAVIDSGIDYTHLQLGSNYAGGYDFVNRDSDPMDDNGHGTHVAGTVAALDDGSGVVGAAPEVKIYALKVLNSNGSGSWSDIIAALQWAVDNGIQVTNNSYGGDSNPGGAVEQAFINADEAGILNVAAAGNSGNNAGKGDNVSYPARYNSVIAVAATDKSDKRAYFSSTGEQVELAAPGVYINSTRLGGGYVEYSGTSMASPHVAGTAALVIAAGIGDKNANGRINDEVRQAMNATAIGLGDPGRDTKYGYGLVDAAAAVASVAPPKPSVNVSMSSDKSSYISDTDTTAVLTAVVTDEYGIAINSLDSLAFAMTLDGVSISTTFTATGITGTYTADLDITNLAAGTHTALVTVTDTRGVSGTGSTTFSIDQASTKPTAVIVDSISYATEGGKNNNLHLLITATLVDNLGNPVSGASVLIELRKDGVLVNSFSGTTNTNGKVTFKYTSAPSGYYESKVTGISAQGLTWDGITPSNGFNKK